MTETIPSQPAGPGGLGAWRSRPSDVMICASARRVDGCPEEVSGEHVRAVKSPGGNSIEANLGGCLGFKFQGRFHFFEKKRLLRGRQRGAVREFAEAERPFVILDVQQFRLGPWDCHS